MRRENARFKIGGP